MQTELRLRPRKARQWDSNSRKHAAGKRWESGKDDELKRKNRMHINREKYNFATYTYVHTHRKKVADQIDTI